MRIFNSMMMISLIGAAALSFTATAADNAMGHDMKHDMSQMGDMSTMSSATSYTGNGVVKAVKGSDVSIAHQPIPALNWPAMTMHFNLASYKGQPLTAGEKIDFTFHQTASGYALDTASTK